MVVLISLTNIKNKIDAKVIKIRPPHDEICSVTFELKKNITANHRFMRMGDVDGYTFFAA